jgi:addiction module HigA family antidote
MLMTANENEFAPVTPGEMLREEFLAEYGLSQNQLAKVLGISPNRIAEIVANRRRITADTALRLSLYFGNSPEFWMKAACRVRLSKSLGREIPNSRKQISWEFPGKRLRGEGHIQENSLLAAKLVSMGVFRRGVHRRERRWHAEFDPILAVAVIRPGMQLPSRPAPAMITPTTTTYQTNSWSAY